MILNNLSRSRKPRVALMGEFSSGKSTLANLLLGQDLSPVQATATQLPAILYRDGEPASHRVLPDGAQVPLDMQDLRSATPDTTAMIQISGRAGILETCDLMDMPGTSDPNMDADYWESAVSQFDCVLWCTPATQAWRQSEAALWERMPVSLWQNSLLVITRMDKVLTERDRARVFRRVQHSVEGQFFDVLPAALLPALRGRDDPEIREQTGLNRLEVRLAELLARFEAGGAPRLRVVAPTPEKTPQPEPEIPAAAPEAEPRIAPRRVVRDSNRHRRPRAGAGPAR